MAICTWDTIRKSSNNTLSNNNLTVSMGVIPSPAFGTLARNKGKYYFEIVVDSGSYVSIGIANEKAVPNEYLINGNNQFSYYSFNGCKYPGGISYGDKYGPGNCIGVAADMDKGTVEFFKNGISQGIAFSNIKAVGAYFYPLAEQCSTFSSAKVTANFGATPFKYPVAGFLAWNEDDIEKPIIEEPIIEEPTSPKLHILLEVGEQIQLIGNTLPEKIGDPNLEWASTLPNIASVDSTGKVTANAEGVTRIQVKTVDGTWTDYALVEVVAKDEGDQDQYRLSILLKVGESCLLKFAESVQDIIWQSDTPTVAVVNPSNAQITRVTAQSPGLTMVTVQTADGSKSDQIYVTVIE